MNSHPGPAAQRRAEAAPAGCSPVPRPRSRAVESRRTREAGGWPRWPADVGRLVSRLEFRGDAFGRLPDLAALCFAKRLPAPVRRQSGTPARRAVLARMTCSHSCWRNTGVNVSPASAAACAHRCAAPVVGDGRVPGLLDDAVASRSTLRTSIRLRTAASWTSRRAARRGSPGSGVRGQQDRRPLSGGQQAWLACLFRRRPRGAGQLRSFRFRRRRSLAGPKRPLCRRSHAGSMQKRPPAANG